MRFIARYRLNLTHVSSRQDTCVLIIPAGGG